MIDQCRTQTDAGLTNTMGLSESIELHFWKFFAYLPHDLIKSSMHEKMFSNNCRHVLSSDNTDQC